MIPRLLQKVFSSINLESSLAKQILQSQNAPGRMERIESLFLYVLYAELYSLKAFQPEKK